MGGRRSDKENHVLALALANKHFKEQLGQNKDAQKYLAGRGFKPETLQRFGVGFASDDWKGLNNYYSTRTMADAACKAGLLVERGNGTNKFDFFRGRLTVPVHDMQGNVTGFGARAMPGMSSSKENEDGRKPPKYLNTPQSEFYQKSELLYGAYQASKSIATTGYAIVVEGYFDVMRLHENEFTMAVGSCGTALTTEQVKLLADMGAHNIYFCFDSDDAGTKAALRAATTALQVAKPWTVFKFVDLDGKDPDDFVKEQGARAFQQKLLNAQSLCQFLDSQFWTEQAYSVIEAKAQYMHHMQQYAMAASGPHRNQIMEHVALRVGLGENDPVFWVDQQAVPREQKRVISNTHMMIGRLLVHDQLPDQARQEALQYDSELAEQLADKNSDLYFLCQQMGEVDDLELEAMRLSAVHQAQMDALGKVLEQVRDMPYDKGLQAEAKQFLRLG